MQTTIAIDDDVLLAARAIAEERHCSLGEVISSLARQGLQRRPAEAERNGIPLLAIRPGSGPVTLDTVNALRDAGA